MIENKDGNAAAKNPPFKWLYHNYRLNHIPWRRHLEWPWRMFRLTKAFLFSRRSFEMEGFRVAVTNICNAACVFCTYPQMKMEKFVMNIDTLKAALPLLNLKDQPYVNVTPSVGDSLIDPKLREKVELLIAEGHKVQVVTNAILLHTHMDWMLELGSHFYNLNLSLPNFDPKEYEVQFGVDKGAQTMRNVRTILERNEALGQPLAIRVQIRNREPAHVEKANPHYKAMKKYFHGKVDCWFTTQWENWSYALELGTWSKHMINGMRTSPIINRPCRNLRFGLVNPDGGVRMCGVRMVDTDQDGMLIGKVGDSIEQLNARGKVIRDKFYHGEMPKVCYGCSFYNPE